MDDDITQLLEALRTDSDRCPAHPVSVIRRRGDRRRSAVRIAAAGGTVAFVGATAGTAFAVAHQPATNRDARVGIAGSTSPSPSPVPSGPSSATPSPVPSPGASTPDSPTPSQSGPAAGTPTPARSETPRAPATPPGNPNPPTPAKGYRGTADPVASPSPASS
jgi:hypothetical protein